MPNNESTAFQRFRNRLEQEKQTLQILDASLINAHREAKSKEGPLASALGYDQNKYDQLHIPSVEGKRVITQAKNANYRAAVIRLYAIWSHYMRDILGLMYEVSPHQISQKAHGEIKFSEAINLGSYEAIKNYIVDHVFRSLESEQSTKKLLDKIVKHTKISLSQSLKVHALAHLEIRHLLVHANGYVDERYHKSYKGIVPCEVGKKLKMRWTLVDSLIRKWKSFVGR
ncbi:hypothetical protein A8U91_04059 [Halomonas elongata]|uniref:Uncharacterized protein n=1 Tax=Halomonas elongata TaxID=2746 RepID=A0A1B8NY99_HALEL|nr:hypothetical protein [Halomonas elongata]OBX34996.1 hypothetical protein A8U91_04059 [Halomonas elongata]